MKALANGQLPLTDKLQGHIDNCLMCRACEAKCPSKVNYGQIMDATRIAIAAKKPKVSTQKISLDELATNKKRRKRDATVFWLLDKSGLRAIGRAFGITKAMGLARLDQLAPKFKRVHDWQSYYPAKQSKLGDVALFTGCFTDLFDQQTLDASIKVLNHLGYGVHVPEQQTCCGALHYHKGDKAQAHSLARQNNHAFANLDIQAIISTASGCGSHLKDYQQLSDDGQTISLKVTDVSEFLMGLDWPTDLNIKPLAKRIAVHEPCSLRNSLKAAQFPYELLQKIPKLEVIPLPGNERCCGSAGSYMLDHPEMADSLKQDKLDAFNQLDANLLATSNIGCSMHIGSGLKSTRTLHPITLLAEQLR